jgi:DNA polymerase I
VTPRSIKIIPLTVAPKAGTYFNTVVCDFESLYPSCIDSFNLSYETVDCWHPDAPGEEALLDVL